MDISKIIEAGKELGYSGLELRSYVEQREKQMLEREERFKKRDQEYELQKMKMEMEKIEAQAVREREEREAQAVREREEREDQVAREEREAQAVKEEREALIKRDLEMKRLEIQQNNNQNLAAGDSDKPATQVNTTLSRPKLPKFDEDKDDIDVYIERFERYAVSQEWKEDDWALSLSTLLSGKGLQVYTSMTLDNSNDYPLLKSALLKRYELTEEGFRRKFRDSGMESGESIFQYIARLKRYFSRWVDLSKIEKSFRGLQDLLITEQFLSKCSHGMTVFLRERKPSDIDELVRLAEQYSEAHSSSSHYSKDRAHRDSGNGNQTSTSSKVAIQPRVGRVAYDNRRTPFNRVEMECYLCHQKGHMARDCRGDRINRHRLAYIRSKSRVRCREADTNDQLSVFGKESDRVASTETNDSSNVNSLDMPVANGLVRDREVQVLRDTGCSSAAVRMELVKPEEMTGEFKECVLIDGTQRRFPTANICVNTPFFVGYLEAMCMEDPVYDLVIGNVKGCTDKPDASWKPPTDIAGVLTRNQVCKAKAKHKPLRVPDNMTANISVDNLKEEQESDDSLRKLWTAAKDQNLASHGKVKLFVCPRAGILLRQHNDNDRIKQQIVVPEKYRNQVMRVAHESVVGGHFGVKKTLDRIYSAFYWPGITSSVSRFCRSCDTCQKTSPKGSLAKVPLGTMPLIESPFSRVAIDLVGPIKPVTDRGHRYILTLVDYATRYPEAVPLQGIETTRIAEALFQIFCRIGFPKEILSDRGTQFTSGLMQEICRLISVKQLFTTPYHPQCNGLCERINGVLKSMLGKMCLERPRDWDRYLPAVLFAYREVPQASTGFSPFELLYGRTIRGPMQVLQDLWTETTPGELRNTYEYVLDLRNRLEDTCRHARENLGKSQEKYKHHYDRRTRPRLFNVGDKVLVLLPKDNNKLLLQWRGPYEVIQRVGPMDYKLRDGEKIRLFHANLLKLYIERDQSGPSNTVASVAVVTNDGTSSNDEEPDGAEELLQCVPLVNRETISDVNISPKLSPKQKQEAIHLVTEFSDIFSEQPGHTNLEEHKIVTTTTEPVRVKSYQIPYAKRQVVHDEVEKMLEQDIIETSSSEYNSPIVLVNKKDGGLRFCIDYRKLNSATKFDSEPMGNAEDIMTKLNKAWFFTKMDLSKGYWQIPMAKESKHLTSFVTPEGCYQFKRMPFGLMNSAATFNRMMRKMLKGIPCTEHYVDDLLSYTQSWEEHMQVLRKLFLSIREAGLTVKPSKCSIGFDSVGFVGHVVGQGRVGMEDNKVQQIQAAERPQTKKQVRSFLGLVGYYRKFIPNFASVAAPLTDLTKKGKANVVAWAARADEAFQKLKNCLACSPILHLPNFSKPFIVQADASDCGVGAVLLQQHGDKMMPISYASRKLLPRECKYSVTERECLALVFAVKKFQNYLYGREFLLQTDHQPLAYIHRVKTESARVMRWALFLQNYKFRIEAIPGKRNVGADYLSRIHSTP